MTTPSPLPRSSATGLRSIGQVLALLKSQFPDISISKIRFLETEGLIAPERAASGYRRYSDSDVERLRYVLSVQRDHYLPLKVIREHLALMDRGRTPPAVQSIRPGSGEPSETSTEPTSTDPTSPDPARPDRTSPDPASSDATGGDETSSDATTGSPDSGGAARDAAESARPSPPPTVPTPPKQPLRLSRQDLLEASGLSEAALAELERTQIVLPKRGTSHYGREALTLAVAAKRMAEYGIDARHLRAFKMSADREVGLVEQAIAPHVRRAGGNKDVSGEVTQLVISFHAALVRTAMER